MCCSLVPIGVLLFLFSALQMRAAQNAGRSEFVALVSSTLEIRIGKRVGRIVTAALGAITVAIAAAASQMLRWGVGIGVATLRHGWGHWQSCIVSVVIAVVPDLWF